MKIRWNKHICMKLAKIAFLVTDENMGLCLYIYNTQAVARITRLAYIQMFWFWNELFANPTALDHFNTKHF